MERIVGPADCALAVALPLSLEDFARQAAAGDRDFARSVVRNCGRSVEQAWREVYRPKVVDLCARVSEQVRALGATVVVGADRTALAGLLERFAVVTVCAHSVLPPIRATDVLAPRAIVEMIERGDSLVAARLRERCGGQRWATESAALREQVALRLDEALAPTRAWLGTTARSDLRGRPPHLDRVMLEGCFGAALRSAQVLELADGIATVDELRAAIPSTFSGVLDLSVCNSVALGRALKRGRAGFLVIENEFLARIDLRLVRYALVLRRLALAEARYTDALVEVSRWLMKA